MLRLMAGCCAVVFGAALVGVPAPALARTGDWEWPLQPRPAVVHGFDPPPQPWLPGHRGVDLAGAVGQPVHSAGAGKVTYAGTLAGIGVVVINHGVLRTTYQPVHASVAAGEQVAAGQVVGRLELAGGHCLPHACLHWGLLRGRTYLDPLTLVGAGPVRLLPLGNAAFSNPADRAPPVADQSAPARPAVEAGATQTSTRHGPTAPADSALPAVLGGLGGIAGALLLSRLRGGAG